MIESPAMNETGYAGEVASLKSGAGLLDFSQSGKIEVSGSNAAQFLNGLVTNEVKSLTAGQGNLAAFLNVHGKVISIARIYRRADSFLLEVEAVNHEKVLKNLSRFVPAGGFEVIDSTVRLGLISIQGPRAATVIETLLDTAFPAEPFSNLEGKIAGGEVLITRHARIGTDGFDVFVESASFQPVRQALLDAGSSVDISPVSFAAFDAARIDAGIPNEPEDVNENRILLEAGYSQAVSYTKGCYLGQEIIARIHWRGQPARQLRRLTVLSDSTELVGAELHSDDQKKVGEITSSALIPSDANDSAQIVALGYVHRNYLNPGTRFSLQRDGATIGQAEITDPSSVDGVA